MVLAPHAHDPLLRRSATPPAKPSAARPPPIRTSRAVAGGSFGVATPAGVGPLGPAPFGWGPFDGAGLRPVAPEHLDGQLDRIGLSAGRLEEVLRVGVLQRDLDVVAPGLGEVRIGIGLARRRRSAVTRPREPATKPRRSNTKPVADEFWRSGISKLGVTMSMLPRASAAVVGDVALGRDERRARLQGLPAAQLDGVPALGVREHGVDVAPRHEGGGLARARAAAHGLALRHVLAQRPRGQHAQLLLQRGGVVGVGVDATARAGDALQLAPCRLVDVEADRLDAHLDAALGDPLGDLARRRRLAGVLAVGDEDDRARPRRPEVLGGALERVGDRGAALGLERADLLLGLGAVERADRQDEARVAARGPYRARRLGAAEHAQPHLRRGRQRAEEVHGGVLRGVDLRGAGAVVGRHRARRVEGEQDLGRPRGRALGRGGRREQRRDTYRHRKGREQATLGSPAVHRLEVIPPIASDGPKAAEEATWQGPRRGIAPTAASASVRVRGSALPAARGRRTSSSPTPRRRLTLPRPRPLRHPSRNRNPCPNRNRNPSPSRNPSRNPSRRSRSRPQPSPPPTRRHGPSRCASASGASIPRRASSPSCSWATSPSPAWWRPGSPRWRPRPRCWSPAC